MLNSSLGSILTSCLVPFVATSLAAQDRSDVELVARSSGCYECHGVRQDRIGPSFQSIAKRYAGDEAGRAELFNIVKNGGKGNWTETSRGVPMPPYSGQLSDEEIRSLVDWLLLSQE